MKEAAWIVVALYGLFLLLDWIHDRRKWKSLERRIFALEQAKAGHSSRISRVEGRMGW